MQWFLFVLHDVMLVERIFWLYTNLLSELYEIDLLSLSL